MRSRTALFPGGVTGAGLLILRVCVAASTVILIGSASPSYGPQLLAVLIAASIGVGLQTRVLAALALLASVLGLDAARSLGPAAVHALSSLALILTGPGAFSVDSRLFGRRTVTLPESDDTNV
jgi:hypothetical protein